MFSNHLSYLYKYYVDIWWNFQISNTIIFRLMTKYKKQFYKLWRIDFCPNHFCEFFTVPTGENVRCIKMLDETFGLLWKLEKINLIIYIVKIYTYIVVKSISILRFTQNVKIGREIAKHALNDSEYLTADDICSF